MKQEKWLNESNFQKYLINMADYAISNRLSNYGYDYKEFRKMSRHKSDLNKLAKIMRVYPQKNFSNDYRGIYARFYFPKDSEKIVYCTGQSQNEEMITVLECLTGTYKNK